MKILLENEQLDALDNVEVYVGDDGSFYYYDGVSYKPVPANIAQRLAIDYAEEERFNEMQKADPSLTRDVYNQQEADRIKAAEAQYDGSVVFDGFKNEKAAKEREARRVKKQKARDYKKVNVVDSSPQALMNDLKTFLDNALIESPIYDWDYADTYRRPKTRTPDSSIIRRGRTAFQVEYEDPDTPLPLITCYFDQSGSFSGSAEKTAFQQSIVDMLNQYADSGQAALDVAWFTNRIVHTGRSNKVPNIGGGTVVGVCLTDMKPKVEGRPSNIIIMTDDDCDSYEYDYANYPDIEVEGSVWIIAVNGTPRGLERKFKMVGPDSQLRVYHFTM